MANDDELIQDKIGRWIGIHEKPGGWKISAFDRDQLYQRYVAERSSTHHTAYSGSSAPRRPSGLSVTHILWQGGSGDPDWNWWVGCSVRKVR